MAVLQAIHGPTPGQLLSVEGDSVVLGRHPDCDVVLDSGSVSRQHARIFQANGNHYVEDLHSRNGTFVNGEAVVGRRLLAGGDELGICDLTFVFLLAEPGSKEEKTAPLKRPPGTAAMLIDDEQPHSNSTIMSKVDVTTSSSGLRLQANTEAKLRALIEILKNLGKTLDMDEVLSKLLDSLFGIFLQADRGFIVLRDQATGRLVPKAVKHRRLGDEETIRISRTIVNSVMTAKEAILSADAAADSRFDMAESIVDFQIRSMMCAPLIGSEGHALGVIQIDTLDQRSRFSREDLDVLASVATPAAFVVANAQLHEAALREQALQRELTVAHEVQGGFLPTSRPQIDGYSFFEFYRSARHLGGDYYDYISLPDRRLAVVVADVSGKGIAASLLMAKLSAETRFSLASEPAPAAAVGRLNQVFCGSAWDDRFVTLILCVLDPVRHEVTIVNAGHMPPLLRCRSGEVTAVAESETRLPLGVDDTVVYPQYVVQLKPADCLTLYTDGITEAMNGANALYGNERLWAQLRASAEGVGGVGQGILDDVKRFVGARSQSDDMCLACFGRNGGEF
ncbi:MAG: SpoIIE family protein phosphatase [Pirellulales bacterium]|nr:SpoIIE family protein phosphatase [Pirellulales bacterium]